MALAWTSAPTDRSSARRAARSFLAQVAAEVLGHDVVVTRRCRRCGSSDHGRPEVEDQPDVGLSLARTGGHAVVAVAVGAGVGIDVERLDADVDRLADVALGPHDVPTVDGHDVLRTWTRKEAVLKAVGVGLLVDPADVGVSAGAVHPRVVAWSSKVVADPRPVTLLDLAATHGLPAGLVGCLAVTGRSRGPVEVVPATSAGR